jgi:chromosome partitioning protein
MKTVAFINQKGGVGKSSCVMHLAGSLAKKNYSILVVDADPQSSLSQGLLRSEDALSMDPRQTIAALYEPDGATRMRDIIKDVGRARLALVPGHIRLSNWNVPNPWTTGPDQFILRDALAEVADEFDYCLLDCPPHIQMCAWSALVAADGAVVPAQMEDFGIQGVAAILDWIDQARASANPRLELLGLLPTMFKPRFKIHAQYVADLREAYGSDVFEATVPSLTDYAVAVTWRKTITEYKPKSAAAKAIDTLADELLARVDHRCGLVHGVPSVLGAERTVA